MPIWTWICLKGGGLLIMARADPAKIGKIVKINGRLVIAECPFFLEDLPCH